MSTPDCLVSEEALATTPSVAKADSVTQQKSEAAAALIDHTNEEIFVWLKLVRSAHSIEPNPEQRPRSPHLSPSQIHALVALKDCTDHKVLGLLEVARLLHHDPPTVALARGPPADSGLNNNLSSLLEPSGPSLFETSLWMKFTESNSSQPGLNPHSRQVPPNNLARHHPIISVDSTLSKHIENHYWCTVCDPPNSYKDSENWKKHEKGHETRYVCGLDDTVDDSGAGQNSSTKPFSCKRRHMMVDHLSKSHGISAVQQGRELADTWRKSDKKQAWSCGFCGILFVNFQDRLKHIDTQHFRKYEDIQDWNFNKVIHGLLLQPRMENAWRRRSASLLPWEREDLVWTQAFAKNMRAKLEIGPSDENDAAALADAVYSAGTFKEPWHENAMGPATILGAGRTGVSSLSLPKHDQALTAQAHGSGPENCQSPLAMSANTHLSGHSLFGRPHRHAYDSNSRAVPTMMAPEEDSQGDYDAPSFYPSQDSAGALERGNDYSSRDQADNEANRGLYRSTGD